MARKEYRTAQVNVRKENDWLLDYHLKKCNHFGISMSTAIFRLLKADFERDQRNKKK